MPSFVPGVVGVSFERPITIILADKFNLLPSSKMSDIIRELAKILNQMIFDENQQQLVPRSRLNCYLDYHSICILIGNKYENMGIDETRKQFEERTLEEINSLLNQLDLNPVQEVKWIEWWGEINEAE